MSRNPKIDWKFETKNYLKSELAKLNISREQLADQLQSLGINETKAAIDNKLSRGSFSATFFVQCLSVIKLHEQGMFPINESDLSINEALLAIQQTLFDETAEPDIYTSATGIRYIDVRDTSPEKFSNNKVISLFSGAGGLDIGLEQAGFETTACVEIDNDCRETIRFNRPTWHLFEDGTNRLPGDIRKIEVDELLKLSKLKKGEAALVTGGAPCQPFSNIGKKQGQHDPRNGDLFLEFVRIVKGTLPRAFIFENVTGITQSKHSDVINYMYMNFEGLGYELSHLVLNAADYGLPQTRSRFILIGIQGKESPAFPLPTHSKGLREWKKFIYSLDHIPRFFPEEWKSIGQAFDELPENYTERPDYAVMKNSEVVINRMEHIGPGENFKVLPMHMRPNCWNNGKHQGQDTFGRPRLDEPSATIRTAAYNPSKGKYIHPTQNRGLDLIEMATLQGFPLDWIFRCKNTEKVTLVSGGKQIGNAVPPPLGRVLGLAIKQQLPAIKESGQKTPKPQLSYSL
jgi:DNA (cytosine-5)-methyltransferase 1